MVLVGGLAGRVLLNLGSQLSFISKALAGKQGIRGCLEEAAVSDPLGPVVESSTFSHELPLEGQRQDLLQILELEALPEPKMDVSSEVREKFFLGEDRKWAGQVTTRGGCSLLVSELTNKYFVSGSVDFRDLSKPVDIFRRSGPLGPKGLLFLFFFVPIPADTGGADWRQFTGGIRYLW
jgi:hypothetical protein